MLGGPQQLLTSVFQAGSAPRSESKRKRLFFTNANFPWFIYTTNKKLENGIPLHLAKCSH
jgi:hypothetical protein